MAHTEKSNMFEPKVEFVYFDVGGVVIKDYSKNNKWQEMFTDLGFTPEQYLEITNAYKELSEGIEEGKITTDDLQKRIFSHASLTAPDGYNMLSDFVDRFEVSSSIHPVIHSLKKTYKVGLLTNMYPDMLDMIVEKELFPSVAWDAVVDSSVVGVAKPQREIYELAEARSGFSGSDIFFVDNLEKNIETAQQLGWQTFLYDPSDPEKSSSELASILH